MIGLLSWLNLTLFDGLPYAAVTLSFVVTFKYIRFPDITCAGTFVFGAATAAAATVYLSAHPLVAVLLVGLGGALGGLLTAFFSVVLRLERLLAGILSAFVLYAISSLILRPTLPYGDAATILSSATEFDRTISFHGVAWHPYSIAVLGLIALGLKLLLDGLLNSEYGLALRALEDEEAGPSVLRNLGLSPGSFQTFSLVLGNAMVAISGALVSMKEGAANVHRGFDILITSLIAFLLGVQLQRWLPDLAERIGRRAGLAWLQALVHIRRLRITTLALAGPILYFGLITLSYSLDVKPELIKLLLAFFVAVTVGDIAVLPGALLRRLRVLSSAHLGLGKVQEARQWTSGSSEALVEAQGLVFRYPGGDGPVVNKASFLLRKGECVLLRGPNGSGKSTLLKLLAGHIEQHEAGTIFINGADLTWAPARRRRSCSYVAQDPKSSIVSTFTAFENLALARTGSRTSPLRRALTRQRVTELRGLLSSFAFSDTTASRPSGSLSGGQRQVLNLLSLLAKRPLPEAVFLDEPFNNLDSANLDRCLHAIHTLRRQGVAVVLVNHLVDLELAIDVCYTLAEPAYRLSNGDRELCGARTDQQSS